MENKEIIREGLEHCIMHDCSGCPNLATEYCSVFNNAIKRAETEAIKEFAEKLKDLSCGSDLYDRDERWVQAVTVEEIDETYKEMVGDSQ